MGRKTIKEYGSHGRSVRVFVETFADPARQELVRVEWREHGKRRTESLPNSRVNQQKAKDYAAAVAERLTLHGTAERARVTMHELGERYLLAHPTPETWRPKTRSTFLGRWKVWLTFVSRERAIDTITPETLDEFRAALRAQDYAINQVANHVQMVKSVFRFARARKYLTENPIADYVMKLSRDQRRLEVPEWTAEECAKILSELSPRSVRHWRTHVAVMLAASLGGRSNALLHLEWRDVDWAERSIRWRPELDKLAKDRPQPLPRDAVRALRIAKVWRARIGYTGPFILPGDARRKKIAGAPEAPFSYQALNQALKNAAARANVTWIDFRAMHSFRRMVVNNVLAATGNLTRAGQFIGDSDMRTLTRSYVRVRADELRDVADSLTVPQLQRAPKAQKRKRRTVSRAEEALQDTSATQRNGNGAAESSAAPEDAKTQTINGQ